MDAYTLNRAITLKALIERSARLEDAASPVQDEQSSLLSLASQLTDAEAGQILSCAMLHFRKQGTDAEKELADL